AGGVLGLGRAAALAGADRTALLLVVELCSLSFQKSDVSKKNLVASALFGDGAAGVLIGSRGRGPRLRAQEEHTWPGTLDVMGWDVVDTGFSVLFSRSIPHLVRSRLRPVLDAFLRRQGLTADDVDEFLCHPGGAKVLDALEDALGLRRGALEHSRRTLADHGNMSAPTVLFSLKEALRGAQAGRKFVLTTLGPGFSAGMMFIEA
ncbi:type III polyketide synthase, partial [bacterium]